MSRSLALLHAVAGVLLVTLLFELARRIAFPWDLLIRVESGFMTDMLKLHNGKPLFGPPTDLNNTVYAPAHEVLTYALLRPFGLDLDVRWCRLVSVTLGFGAAAAVAFITARGRARWLAFAAASLLLFRNLTSDAPHPDHLHALHALMLLALCERAVARGSLQVGLAAMLLAALGPVVKLEAALAPLGAGLALLTGRRWRPRDHALLLVGGTLAWATMVGLVLRSPDARAFLSVLLGHTFNPLRLWSLLVFVRGHLLVLALLAIPCALHVRRTGEAGRRLVLVWLCVGAAEVLPNIAGWAVQTSDANAFGIVALWSFLVVWSSLAGRWATEEEGPLALAVIAVLLFVLFPERIPPAPAAYRYGELLELAIARDVEAGRRVLLAHGTMPLIRNGMTSVPLDRADAVGIARLTHPPMLDGMTERMRSGAYGRIYANSPGYALFPEVARNYRKIGVMPKPVLFPYTLDGFRVYLYGYRDVALGYDPAMGEVTILEPKP